MDSRLVKGLTVAAGLGLAIGIGSGNRRAEENRMGTKSPDDVPEAGPIAERLDRIEARISAIETRTRISARSGASAGEIETLHAEVAAIEKRFEGLAKEIPAVLESIVGPRVDDLRKSLRTEVQQAVGATLAKFERTIGNKLADRLATVEKAVREQSVTVNALSRRAVESDANMQRLVGALERLWAGEDFDPAALRESFFAGVAVKGQTKPGGKRKQEAPVQPIEFESKFQHQIISEEEPDPPKHHRRPMARL